MNGLEDKVRGGIRRSESLKSRHRPRDNIVARAVMAMQDYGRDEESIRSPYEHGTNAYFSDIGLNNSFVNNSVRIYNEDAVKTGARLAYDAGIREGDKSIFNILFALISAEGKEVTENLIFRVGIGPDQLDDYFIRWKSNILILAPKDARNVVNKEPSRNVASVLAQSGINLVYSRPTFMAFNYANR